MAVSNKIRLVICVETSKCNIKTYWTLTTQNWKCTKPQTSLDWLNILSSYVACESNMEHCDLGFIIFLQSYQVYSPPFCIAQKELPSISDN